MMDNKAYATVIKSICAKLGIDTPDNTLIRNVFTYCKNLDHNKLRDRYQTIDERLAFIAESYLDSIKNDVSFDYQDYLKHKTAPVRTLLSTDWIGEHLPIISSKAMSVYLDSRVRNISNYVGGAPITNFTFMLVPRQTRSELGDGRIQVRVMPSQITYFKLGKIILPYGPTLRQRNYTNELTLTFTALRSNGIIAQEDTYHFAMTYEAITTNTNLVELTPVNKYCKFNPPLRLIDDISLQFNDPIYPVSFSHDRLRPSQFNYLSSDGRIVFDTPHGLIDNDIIIVMGLTTNNDAANGTILAAINNPRGIVITRINDNVIATGIDFTLITNTNLNSKPWVLFYSKMFRFPLEIGYQDVSEL